MAKKKQPEPARYYIVANKANPQEKCLVAANRAQQALGFAAQHFCTARIATTAEAFNMHLDGYPIIRPEPQPEQMDIDDVLVPPAATTGESADSDTTTPKPQAAPPPKCDGNHAGPRCTDPQCYVPADGTRDGDGVWQGGNWHPNPPAAGSSGQATATTGQTGSATTGSEKRKGMIASDVFGKGFTRESED